MIETGWSQRPQLYDLETDIGERDNLAEKMPAKAAELQAALDTFVDSGFRGYSVNHEVK
jgi:hypothetical protein